VLSNVGKVRLGPAIYAVFRESEVRGRERRKDLGKEKLTIQIPRILLGAGNSPRNDKKGTGVIDYF